jgi:hypothetical protein
MPAKTQLTGKKIFVNHPSVRSTDHALNIFLKKTKRIAKYERRY